MEHLVREVRWFVHPFPQGLAACVGKTRPYRKEGTRNRLLMASSAFFIFLTLLKAR